MSTTVSWLLLATICAAPPDIWPGFLGGGCGADDASTLPLTWSDSHNLAWVASVPERGLSSPTIWKDRLFVTSIASEDDLVQGVVTAVRLSDGTTIWRRSATLSRKLEIGTDYSNAAPTPVVDARAIYALFESGDLIAFTHAGEELWRRSLVRDIDEIAIESGLASSLAQDEASVFCLVDHERQSYLAAFDKRTGERRWIAHRDNVSSWSSPICVSIAGVPQVVVSSSGSVDGYDAQEGKRLWTFGGLKGNSAPTPHFVAPNRLLIGATLERGAQPVEDVMHSNFAMQIVRGATSWRAELAWPVDGAISGYASPVANSSHAYWLDRHGRLTCFSLADGHECYCERACAAAWATPLAVGDRIYIAEKSGTTTVVRAGDRFEILARNVLNLDDVEQRLATRPAPTESATQNLKRGADEAPGGRSLSKARDSTPPTERTNVYAVCAVNGSLILRTNKSLICVRESRPTISLRPPMAR